jgi:hypothetical protein
MITINSQPKEIDFSGNPLAFKLSSDEYIVSAGVEAYMTLTKVGTLTGGQTFIVSFLDYDLTFRVGTGSTDDGLYIPTSATIDQLLEYMSYNYLLTKYYNCTKKSSTELKFEAIEVGTEFNIEADVTNSAGLTTSKVAGTDRLLEANFKMFWQLYFKNKYRIYYDSIPEQFADVDEDGEVTIHINKILEQGLNTISIELPEFNTQFLKEGKKILFTYYLKFAEFYGSDPAVMRLNESDVLYAIKGNLPFDKFPGHDFYGDLQLSGAFLTNKTQPIETFKEAQQFLTWINTGSTIDTLAVVVRCYRKASPASPMVMVRDWFYDVDNKDVIVCPAGYNQLYVQTTGDCFKYEVYLAEVFDDSPPVIKSEVIEFTVLPKPLFAKQFLYRNNFGAYETLIAEKVQNKFEIETQIYEKDLEYDYQLPSGEMVVITENAHNKYTVRTGTMNKVAADHLCEMLSNNEVYITGNLQFIPIIIEKGSVELSDEADDLFMVKFDYRYTINGKLSEDA